MIAAQVGRRKPQSALPATSRDVSFCVMNADSRARWLMMEASIELQHGHVAAAERLSHRAAEMRGQAL